MAAIIKESNHTAHPVSITITSTNREGQSLRILRCFIAVWLLGHYLLPNTFFDRISPGGLILESQRAYPHWLVFTATVILCVIAVLALKPVRKAQPVEKHLPLWLLITVFCVPVLAAIGLSPDKHDLASELIALATGVIVVRIARRPQQIIALISLTAFIQAVYTVIYHREHINLLLSGSVWRAGGTFNEPNNLYVVMLFALPFTITGVLQAKSNLSRIGYLVASSAAFAALSLTWFRGGALALAASLAMLTWLLTRSKPFTVVVLICLLGLFGAVQTVRINGVDNAASISGSNAGRVHLWREGWRAFASHPLTGGGPGSFNVSVVTKTGGQTNYHSSIEPKNLLLDWLAERGVVGGLLFCLLIWTISATIRSSLPSQLSAAIAAAWIGLLTAGLVDTPFGPPDRYVGNCCFGLLIGITALLPSLRATETPTTAAMGQE